MPIYVFQCRDCCQEFQTLRTIENRDDEFECPNCHALLSRAITATDFRMKGGTRGHRKIKMWSVEDRMRSKYGFDER